MTAGRILTPEEHERMSALVQAGFSRHRISEEMHVGRPTINRAFPDLGMSDPRSPKYRIPTDEYASIKADVGAGFTMNALTSKYHHDSRLLKRHFPEIEIKPYALRNKDWSPELVAKLEAAFDDGWPLAEICATYGVSNQSLRNRFRGRPDYPNQRDGLREAQQRRHMWAKIHEVWDLPGGPAPFVGKTQKSGPRKLTQDKVRQIRELSAQGLSGREIGARLNLSKTAVNRSLRGVAITSSAQ